MVRRGKKVSRRRFRKSGPTASRPVEAMIVDTIHGTINAGTTQPFSAPDQIPPRRPYRIHHAVVEFCIGTVNSGPTTAPYGAIQPQVAQVRLLGPPEFGAASTTNPNSSVHWPILVGVIPRRVVIRNNAQQDWFTDAYRSYPDIAIDHPQVTGGLPSVLLFYVLRRYYQLGHEYERDNPTLQTLPAISGNPSEKDDFVKFPPI